MNGLLLTTALEGNVLAQQGKLHEAAERYQQVRETTAEGREFAVEAAIRQAALRYEWNALEVAEALLVYALAESSALVGSTLLGRGVLSLAYALQARGEHEAASALFTQAVTVAQQQRHALVRRMGRQLRPGAQL